MVPQGSAADAVWYDWLMIMRIPDFLFWLRNLYQSIFWNAKFLGLSDTLCAACAGICPMGGAARLRSRCRVA